MHQKLGSTAAPLATSDAVSTLTAEEGASSNNSEDQEAASLSLASAMAENAPGVSQHLMPRLRSMLDLDEHNSLSPTQIKIYRTPRGELLLARLQVPNTSGLLSGLCVDLMITRDVYHLACTLQVRWL